MRNKPIVKRYAEAYVSFALPKIGLPGVVEDMRVLRTLMRENPELGQFFIAPGVPFTEKSGVIDRALSGVLRPETCDFIKYLISKMRVDIIFGVTDYIRIVYARGEVVDAVLRTTFPLELDLVDKIKKALEKRTGKNVNLYLELSPDLLGGVQISIGNSIIDGSIRSNLDDIKKQLLKIQVLR